MKKKILALCLVVALLATAIAGATLAYFTDTQDQTNTFVSGKVDIKLDEVVVEKDEETGNLVGTDERTENDQEYRLYPAMTVDKDPTITVETGSEDAYVAAIMTVTFAEGTDLELLLDNGVCLEWKYMLNAASVLKGDYIGDVDPKPEHPLFGKNEMQVYGDERYSVYQIADAENLTYKIYMFFEDVKKAGDTITPFNQIVIPETWDNDDMAAINGMKIEVDAYAVQAYGFDNCYEAITAAFGDDAFKF